MRRHSIALKNKTNTIYLNSRWVKNAIMIYGLTCYSSCSSDIEFYIQVLPKGDGCTFSIMAVLNSYNVNTITIKMN